MSERLKILSVVGARPNFVKMAPLLHEMKRHVQIESFLVHTGQHYDEKLSEIFFRQLNIPAPNANLNVGSGSHAAQTAEIMRRIEPVLLENRPDLVLVVGDVNSTVAASLTAAKLEIPLAHVEAGLRSFDRKMPEEINRVLTDALADYLFATEEQAIDNLIHEGRPSESIYFVGNVMIDALLQFLPLAEKSRIGEDLGMANGSEWSRYALLTLHRPSNVDSVDDIRQITGAVNTVAEKVPVIFPVHPRTAERLTAANLSLHPSVKTVPPLAYLDFLSLLSHSTFVFTDSGGIQEETTALGVPCLTLRENTERPVTVTTGTNVLVGRDPQAIIHAAEAVLLGNTKKGKIPELWDGCASGRIVKRLLAITGRCNPLIEEPDTGQSLAQSRIRLLP